MEDIFKLKKHEIYLNYFKKSFPTPHRGAPPLLWNTEINLFRKVIGVLFGNETKQIYRQHAEYHYYRSC
jgi:hypothetical protein